MSRMTEEDLMGTLSWEGYEYALTDLRSEEMPTAEASSLLEKVQEGVKELFAYFESLE